VKRVFYVDLIRSYAILMVVVSHVFAPVCAAMMDYPRSVWWVFNLLDSWIRPCVPLFVMISGKLLLGSSREDSYLRFVWRRYSGILLPFFTWSLIYAYYECRMRGSDFSLPHAILQFLQGPTEYHLWFMYMILGLYLVAPFLRRWVQAALPGEIQALLVLWFGFLTLQFLFPGYISFAPGITLLNYGGYFVLGYFLDQTHYFEGKTGRLILLSLAIILFNAGGTFLLTLWNSGILDEKFYGGVAPLIVLYASASFLILKNINEEAPLLKTPGLRGTVLYISQDSFNLYLIHAFFIWLFIKGHLGFVLSEDTGPSPLIGVPLTTTAVLACSLGLSFILGKIPGVSRLFVTNKS
jgi:surface polysaccharide O-acyltransferase-like enzyme